MFLQKFLDGWIRQPTHLIRLFSNAAKWSSGKSVFELDHKQQADLERRKVTLYELAQKEFALRDLPKINEELGDILKDFPPCMHAFNIVLKTYILLNDTAGIRRTIESITKEGMKPNTITYSLLISYYRNNRKMEDAVAVYERMKAAQVKANGSIFTTLIAGFASQGNFSMAESYFNESQLCPWIKSDLHLLNTMIGCYLSAGKPEEARKLAGRMLDEGLKPNYVTYKVFLLELLESKHIEEAVKLYDLHLKDDAGMRAHDHGDIATRFFKAGDTSKGLSIFETCLKKYKTCAGAAFPYAIDEYSYRGQDDKLNSLIDRCWSSRTIFAHSCHPLLRHFVRRRESSKISSEVCQQHISKLLETAKAYQLLLSPKLELKCKEIIGTTKEIQ